MSNVRVKRQFDVYRDVFKCSPVHITCQCQGHTANEKFTQPFNGPMTWLPVEI